MTTPLVFSRYGITLKELEQDDIELVRQWRNDPKIAELMLDRSYITPERQQAWFERVSQASDEYYFLAIFKDQAIGVASLIKIERQAGHCEPGMYIYNAQYRNNIVPFCLAFALNDLAFETFGLTRLLGKIYSSNRASLEFHQACGYRFQRRAEHEALEYYSLNWPDYLAARAAITRFIRY